MATSNLLEGKLLERIRQTVDTSAMLEAGEQTTYLYDTLFPTVSVAQTSGTAFMFDISKGNNYVDDQITDKSVPNEIGSNYKEITYTTNQHALRYFIGNESVENFGYTAMYSQASMEVTRALRGNFELRFLDYFLSDKAGWKFKLTGNATTNLGSNQIQYWSDSASDPIKDIVDMVEANVKYAGNVKMNRAIMSKDTWIALTRHPDVSAKLQAGSDTVKADMALQQEFAKLLGLERVDIIDEVVGTAIDTKRAITTDGKTPNIEEATVNWKRKSSGMFALYHYEPARTLQTRSAGVMIDVPSRKVSFNRGLPTFKVYKPSDEGQEGTWLDGRIRGGMLMTNPSGLILCTGMLQA